jgi:hypothetical protein
MVTKVFFVYLLHMQTSKTEALTMGTHRRVHSILNKIQRLSKLYMIMRILYPTTTVYRRKISSTCMHAEHNIN